MLTTSEIEQVREIIRRHFLAFTADVLGTGGMSPDELAILERAGIVRRSERHLITDPYEFGKISALVGPAPLRRMNLEEVKSAVLKGPPMTDVERAAVAYASTSAGQYIRGVMDMTLKDASTASAASSGAGLRAIQDGVADAVANRETVSELQSTLFHLIDNKDRDWQRIAHTEMSNAIQNGIYHEIRENSDDGADQLIYKLVNSDACKWCKALYLKGDGITPRVFRLSDLDNTNVGRRARDWQAVIGTTHPWCNCQLVVVPDGNDFVHERRVKENFEHDGEDYKRGQIVNDALFGSLSAEDQEKVRMDATLRFTGTTALPDATKGMINMPIHADHDEPICEH